ncbi:MAG: hypothetical protein ACR2MG_10910 [Pyrinomonadaceae bacterium]
MKSKRLKGSSESIGICGVNIDVLPGGYKYDLQKRELITSNLKQIMKGA